MRAVIFLLTFFHTSLLLFSQPVYNNCNSAFELCPNETYSFNNLGANVTFCPGCEDDFNFCFPTDNTIWLSFTTNTAGGDVLIDITNLNFEVTVGQDTELQAALIQAVAACDASTYSLVGTCTSNETGDFTLSGLGLLPLTTYYIVIDGDNAGVGITNPAECSFDVEITGPGIDRTIPTANVMANNNSACQNEVVTFTVSLTDCPDNGSFTWFINDVAAATTADTFWSVSNLQDGDIVSVESSCFTQCVTVISADALPISVYSFFIDAGEDIIVNQGDFVQLAGQTTAPIHQWSPSFGVSSTTDLNAIATPVQTTTYSLTAEENGCVLTDQVTIFISESLEIPNTFSPNGDNDNDVWVITGIEQFPDNQLKIFTRWGQEVYSTSGYSELKAWDGTAASGNVSEGVYYYILELRDEEKQLFKGHLNVVR